MSAKSSEEGSLHDMAKRGRGEVDEAQELWSSREAEAEAESLGERFASSPAISVELEQILFTSYLLISKFVTALVPLNLIAAMS
jgi:hypothetical protein